ncbi:MAG: putative membrane protein [Sulfitobacter sp.]|jgi:inner membrane protein YidH
MIVNYADHASNERTFLSWVRTTIAIVGFGLATARLGAQQNTVYSEVLLLLAGAVVVFLAYLRMRHVRGRIAASETIEDDAVPVDTLLLVLIAALFALLGIFVLHVS